MCELDVPTPISLLEACLGARTTTSLLRGVIYMEPSQTDFVQLGCLGPTNRFIALTFSLFPSNGEWVQPSGLKPDDLTELRIIIELRELHLLNLSMFVASKDGTALIDGASEHPPTLGCQQTGAASSSGSTGPSLAVVAAAGAGAIVLVGALAAFALHRRRRAGSPQVSAGRPDPFCCLSGLRLTSPWA